MNPSEVIVHVEQRDHRHMIVNLLAERIGQPSKAPHVHPHIKILPLHIRRADMVVIR